MDYAIKILEKRVDEIKDEIVKSGYNRRHKYRTSRVDKLRTLNKAINSLRAGQ